MNTVDHVDFAVSAAAGNDAALAALVRVYHDRVYRYGLRACRDAFDAEDAVQEAFVKLAKRPDIVRERGVLSWLFTVVRNQCVRMFRPLVRERRSLGERADAEGEADVRELDAEKSLERFQLVATVHAAIAALELPYREVLVLRDLEGLSGSETCAVLGLEVHTMKTRLHRARNQLRTELYRRGLAPSGQGER